MTLLPALRALHRRPIVRFGLVSVAATALDYAVLLGALRLLAPGGHPDTAATAAATAAGYLVGTLVNYAIARRWVFRPSAHAPAREFALVLAVQGVGLALTEALTVGLSQHGPHWSVLLAKTVAVVLVFFWNYLGRRLLVYPARRGPSAML
jgi:putative flippase GtrA